MAESFIIKALKKNNNTLTLEQFINLALHHPQHGYYANNIAQVGKTGDFSTTATLSPILGKALAHEYKKTCIELGTRLPIIEIGGGNGALALAFKKSLPFWQRLTTTYIMVETSTPLRQIQKKKLKNFIRHFTTPQEALQFTQGKAFIFSNELVDAFSPTILQHTPQGWAEIAFQLHEQSLRQITLPPLTQNQLHNLNSSALDITAPTYPYAPDQQIEIAHSYKNWLNEWAPHWTQGKLITIDYGDTIENLYYRRPQGTLRAYKNHTRRTGLDVFRQAGQCDITYDINFTDLQTWGKKHGWQTQAYLTQREFLLPHATPAEVDTFLTHPQGAGTAFKVLIQTPHPNK